MSKDMDNVRFKPKADAIEYHVFAVKDLLEGHLNTLDNNYVADIRGKTSSERIRDHFLLRDQGRLGVTWRKHTHHIAFVIFDDLDRIAEEMVDSTGALKHTPEYHMIQNKFRIGLTGTNDSYSTIVHTNVVKGKGYPNAEGSTPSLLFDMENAITKELLTRGCSEQCPEEFHLDSRNYALFVTEHEEL